VKRQPGCGNGSWNVGGDEHKYIRHTSEKLVPRAKEGAGGSKQKNRDFGYDMNRKNTQG